jgi:hypothetical protein
MPETVTFEYVISSKHPNKPTGVVVQDFEKQINDLKNELVGTGAVTDVRVERVGTLPLAGLEGVIIKIVIALATGAATETGKILTRKIEGWFERKTPDAHIDRHD